MSDAPPATGALRIVGRVMRLGLARPWAFAANLAGMLGMAAIAAFLMWAAKDVLGAFGMVLADRARDLTPAEQEAAIAQLQHWGLVLSTLAIPAGLVAGGAWYAAMYLGNRTMMDLRASFLRRFLSLDLGFHSLAAKGDMIARMSADMETCTGLVHSLYGKVLVRPVEVLATFITVMVIVDWRLAVVLPLIYVPVILFLIRNFRRTRRRADRARETLASTLTCFEQAATGIRVITSLGRQDHELARFQAINQQLMHAGMRTAKTRGQADLATYTVAFLIPGLAMLASIWLIRDHVFAGAEIGVFLAAIVRSVGDLRTVQRAWGEILMQAPAAARIFDVLDRRSAIRDEPGAPDCPAPRQHIRLDGVTFRYAPGADAVLDGCDLDIPVGSTVALVGESGAGKSTILDLIPRFRDVEAGAVRYDGVDVRRYRQASVVGHIAIVQQEPFLFNDTVLANILYGRPGATRAEVEQAARRAHVHDAILALEGGKGYDTVVGDRGERLSGGQRQRVSIARALLRDAPILILDEPTSALDAESEAHVQAALAELMQGRTSIIVAHRLATIQHADRICVLSRKTRRVVEQGTHRELLAQGGEYARLVELQQLAG